ncbi:MAG: hypothetical protein GYA51_04915 [Candidatus Methanofastidiosa archaeon]|jgi:hypothetical protein|nr:hypothetical protein [Candidatus Methanofastidiosa archaeon]
MKKTTIVFALIFLITFAMFSGCVSQNKDNGTNTTSQVVPEKTIPYLKAKITISKPYDLSDLNSSRQKVVIIRDYGTKLIAEVTLYSEEYYLDEYALLPYIQTEEDAIALQESLPKDILPYVLPTNTVLWESFMRERVSKLYAKDANYSIVGTAYLIMKDQKQIIVLDESPYTKIGYEHWWLQPATDTISAESHKALGYGPYVTLYAALMRSLMEPTKIVYGLYYDIEEGGVWKPYAWTEIYINGKWIPVDPYREKIGTLSRYYLKLDEVIDLVQVDFSCYISEKEGKGCKPFQIEIIEQGSVPESEIKK